MTSNAAGQDPASAQHSWDAVDLLRHAGNCHPRAVRLELAWCFSLPRSLNSVCHPKLPHPPQHVWWADYEGRESYQDDYNELQVADDEEFVHFEAYEQDLVSHSEEEVVQQSPL